MKEAIFQDFLNELAHACAVEKLTMDLHGACLLDFIKHHIEVLCEYDDTLVPNTILLSAKITSMGPQALVDILEEVLISNFYLKETVSCYPGSQMLYLHRRIHPKATTEELSLIISSFLEQVRIWREKVRALEAAPPKQHRIPIPPSSFIIYPFQG